MEELILIQHLESRIQHIAPFHLFSMYCVYGSMKNKSGLKFNNVHNKLYVVTNVVPRDRQYNVTVTMDKSVPDMQFVGNQFDQSAVR